MKKGLLRSIVSIVLVAIMCVSLVTISAYADDWGNGTYKVVADTLSIRSDPEVADNKIGKITKGTTIVVTDIIGSAWGYTTVNDISGWVSMEYLQFQSFDLTLPVSHFYVNCDALSVRSQVKTSSKLMGTLDRDTIVNVDRTLDVWSHVTYEDVKGWVMTKYLIKRYESLEKDVAQSFSSCKVFKNANLRTGPGSEYNVRMVIPGDDTITVSMVKNGFAFTSYEDTLGWVSLDLLDYKGKSKATALEPFSRSATMTAGDGAVYANGVDLSKWNGTKIDWPLLKESGIDFVILKVGSTTGGKDSSFDDYYQQAKAVGIDVGAYFYTYAQSVTAAEKDAKMCMEWLKGTQLEYPVFYDIEDTSKNGQINLSKTTCTKMCEKFCDTLLLNGWYPGIYTMVAWWSSKLDYNVLGGKYESWVARVASRTSSAQCTPSGTYDYASQFGMYQWNWCGRLPAIKGVDVDLDVAYKDFPSIIKKKNLNGFNSTGSRSYYVEKMYGDATNDEDVNMNDVVYMQKTIAKLAEMNEEEFVLADVNGDEALTLDDVVSLQQYIAGLKKVFAMG